MIKSKKGVVTSNKMDKTVVVTVHTYKLHPIYKKRFRTSKKFYAHDPENTCKIGEEITIYQTHPLSKTKRWSIIKSEIIKPK